MSVLICHTNRWRDGSIIAVSSEAAQFSAEYTQDDSPQLFWRSRNGTGTGNGLFVVMVDVNDHIDLAEGAGELPAMLTPGNYNGLTLAAEIKTQLDVAGALTYTVTYNETTGKFTIAAGGNFKLLWHSGSHNAEGQGVLLGFAHTDLSGAATYTSDTAVFHSEEYIDCDLGAAYEWDFIGILGHNFTPDATIGIYGTDAELVELCVNGRFDSGTSSWTPWQCTIASIAGGQSGNCLEITRVSGTSQNVKQVIAGLVVGASYTFTTYVKSGSSGNEAFQIVCNRTSDYGDQHVQAGTTSGSWIQYSITFTATDTSYNFYLYKVSATAGTMLFDTVSVLPTYTYDSLTYQGNNLWAILGTARTKRWVRLSVIDTANPSGYLQVGTVVIGKGNAINRRPSIPYQRGPLNETEIEYSPSANLFTIQERPSLDNKSLSFTALNDASELIIEALLEVCGSHMAWALCLDSTAPNTNSYWVHLKNQGLPECQHVNNWNWICETEEVL